MSGTPILELWIMAHLSNSSYYGKRLSHVFLQDWGGNYYVPNCSHREFDRLSLLSGGLSPIRFQSWNARFR